MLRKETKIFENDFDAATANDLASSSLDLANVFYEDTGVENNEYAYDANGNQITKTAESKTEINTYDGLNQLIGFTDGETTASYKYNADGLRTSKTVDGKTINHIWDGNKQIVVDMDDSDWYSAEVYVRGTNLLAKFSKQSGNVKTDYQYYTQNAHGDVVNLTDSTGAITKSYKYDAFGVEQNVDDADDNAFRYCGEYFDAETGTIYLRARYYDPSMGRFISRDSYAGKIKEPLSLNLYTYCENNPILYMDSSGHNPAIPYFGYLLLGAISICALTISAQVVSNPQTRQSLTDASNSIKSNLFNSLNTIKSATQIPEMDGKTSNTKSKFSTAYDSTANPYLSKWSDSFEKAKENVKEKDITITSNKKKYDPVIFPENPDDFNPVGMQIYPYPTPNGMIYKWGYCKQTAIFEWDEDYKNGSHYHCMMPEWNNKHDESEESHFKAGMVMPEPWASMYRGY